MPDQTSPAPAEKEPRYLYGKIQKKRALPQGWTYLEARGAHLRVLAQDPQGNTWYCRVKDLVRFTPVTHPYAD